MSVKDRPIGVFDSGIGGLTVLKELRSIMPKEDIIYLGDIAHLPYGTKSESVIIKLSIANIIFLLEKNVKTIVVACNSTSSVALPKIESFFNIPILGVVEAGVKFALENKDNRIGVIGTPATIQSQVYQGLIKKKNPEADILTGSCPLFVPLVEEGWLETPVTDRVVSIYLERFRDKVDSLILGCTHYPLLKKSISKTLQNVKLIDSAQAVADQSYHLLKRNGILKDKGEGRTSFFLTDNSPYFSKLTEMIIREKVTPEIVENV